ncbi:hypothetical protein [Rhodopila sp.]|uniref:hypothetical protein n=1 Tax=Rhodopila sp. TaxID=2480087 RepID=UPI003D09F2F3
MASGPSVLTPELEPGIVAAFKSLMVDHTAFIMGFADGRELHERVIRAREAAAANPDLQSQSNSVLHPMTSIPRLLAERARRMVQALTRALAATPSAAFDLLASSTDVARNSIVAFARAFLRYCLAPKQQISRFSWLATNTRKSCEPPRFISGITCHRFSLCLHRINRSSIGWHGWFSGCTT